MDGITNAKIELPDALIDYADYRKIALNASNKKLQSVAIGLYLQIKEIDIICPIVFDFIVNFQNTNL